MGVIIYPGNDGFELPDLGSGPNAYGYANSGGGSGPLTIPSWTFIGGSGVAANGSAFNTSNATNGNFGVPATSTAGQAGLMQGGDGTIAGVSISQAITLPAGTAVLNYSEEARSNAGVDVNVYLDGTLIGSSSPVAGNTFDPVVLSLGVVAAGSHTIAFAGNQLIGGDRTTFIDNVSVTVTPEPSSIVLLVGGAVGLLLTVRRQRRA